MLKIQLRYIELKPDVVRDALFAEAMGKDVQKAKLLERLGIEARDRESPFRAWLRTMAEDNGFPDTQPIVAELRQAIMDDPGAARFMFYLA